MKRMLAGVLVALPLLVAAMPKQASAKEVIVVGERHAHHRWIPGYWARIHHHHVWIRGHYERW